MNPVTLLLASLALIGLVFVVAWARRLRADAGTDQGFHWPTSIETAGGFVTNFFDTLGIGSFAPTTSSYKLWKLTPDEKIPGTLNIGHTPPVLVQAFIFVSIVEVETATLIAMTVSAILGGWLGAGVVSRWPRRRIQVGIGIGLLVAGLLFLGGDALGLHGAALVFAALANFVLGALVTLGIGSYAPCLIMISLLGMNPRTAFPIMMGSCAFMMPIASLRFLKAGSYAARPALGLALGGIPAVLIAAFIVKTLPLTAIRWLVLGVVVYTGVTMLRSARSAP